MSRPMIGAPMTAPALFAAIISGAFETEIPASRRTGTIHASTVIRTSQQQKATIQKQIVIKARPSAKRFLMLTPETLSSLTRGGARGLALGLAQCGRRSATISSSPAADRQKANRLRHQNQHQHRDPHRNDFTDVITSIQPWMGGSPTRGNHPRHCQRDHRPHQGDDRRTHAQRARIRLTGHNVVEAPPRPSPVKNRNATRWP